MAIATRVIDGDGHINEDMKAIAKYLPAHYQRSMRTENSVFGIFPPLDHFHFHVGQTPATLQGRGFVGPDGWGEFLDDVGIETTVLYPTLALAYGRIPYDELAIAACQAYNNWLYDTYLQNSPRFQGMGIIPMQRPEEAVKELRRIVQEQGMVGAMLPSNGLKAPLGDRMYWPIFEEADRLGCALAVHGGCHIDYGMDQMHLFAPIHALGHPHGIMVNFGSMVFNGVFDKFPNARYAFLESGVSWLLLAMERFSGSYAAFRPYETDGYFFDLKEQKVSDYIKRHITEGRIFVGIEGDEPDLAYMVKKVGSTPFLYSSDFPHEVTNETCKEEIEELRENDELTEEDKENILCKNAERFYKLKVLVA